MKAGIITYHDTRNYGATLQAYALQKKVEKLNIDCEIIDYKCETITKRYSIKKITELRSIKEFIKYILSNSAAKKLQLEFNNFNETYLKLSNKEYYKDNIREANKVYDLFITGSDQVWNLELSGEDTSYFLDFVDSDDKKNSYAASFGYKYVPEKYRELNKKLLENYNRISVREKQGENIIHELLKKKSQVVLDPTLLLRKNEWKEVIKKPLNKKEYILLYRVASTPHIIEFTKNLAKKTGCEIIYINSSYKIIPGMKNIRNANPQEFLGYIENAKYVVSSSFHGVIFSIIFEKNFFYELSNNKNNFNSRIENIVSELGLKERIILNGENSNIYKNINYDIVNEKLDKKIDESTKYLKAIVGDNNE